MLCYTCYAMSCIYLYDTILLGEFSSFQIWRKLLRGGECEDPDLHLVPRLSYFQSLLFNSVISCLHLGLTAVTAACLLLCCAALLCCTALLCCATVCGTFRELWLCCPHVRDVTLLSVPSRSAVVSSSSVVVRCRLVLKSCVYALYTRGSFALQ